MLLAVKITMAHITLLMEVMVSMASAKIRTGSIPKIHSSMKHFVTKRNEAESN